MPGVELAAPVENANGERSRHHPIWGVVLLFAFGVVAFVIALPPEHLKLDARYALFAREMLRNGPSLFPTTYLGPYPDYPATIILPIYWLSHLFGRVTPFTVVLPTAFVSAGILVFIYKIAALRSAMWGVYAVCLAMLTFAFVQASRCVSPDQYTTLVTSACFYIAYSAGVLQKRRRLWLLPFLLVVGYACRGPIGLIVPGAVLCAFYFFNSEWKAFALAGVVVLVLLVLCSVALLAAAQHQGGKIFADRVVAMQAFGRVHGGSKGFFYYWISGFVTYACVFPLAMALMGGQWKAITKRKDVDSRLLCSLAVWVAVVLVGLSIPGEKKNRYVLAIVPPMALMAAYLFLQPVRQSALAWIRESFLRLCAVLPWLAGIGCAGRSVVTRFTGTGEEMFLGRAIVCMVLAAGIALAPVGKKDGGLPGILRTLIVGAVSLWLVTIGIVEPITFERERSGPFVEHFAALQEEQERPVVFYRMGPDQEDIALAANYDKLLAPVFVDSVSDLLNRGMGAYVITNKKHMNKLSSALGSHFTVITRGRLAGEPCVILTMGKMSGIAPVGRARHVPQGDSGTP